MEDQVLQIEVDAGIGDFSWVYSKLVNLDIPLRVILPEVEPRRGHQLLKMLPNVHSYEFSKPKMLIGRFFGNVIGANTCQDMSKDEFLEFCESKDWKIWFSLNTHLEEGRRIEEYIPDLPTDYHYNICTPEGTSQEADKLLGDTGRYLLLYTSSYKNGCMWAGWDYRDWRVFVELFRDWFSDIDVVLIGAKWDIDDGQNMEDVMPRFNNLVGKTSLPVVLEIIKRSEYFVAFPSGLAILANVLNKPTWMFYPEHLEPMLYAWADPKTIQDDTYKASLWCKPLDVLRWMDETYNMKERLK